MGFDYRQYVSFDKPDVSPNVSAALPPQFIQVVEYALNQFSQTPEGRALIQEAASHSPDGKIHFGQWPYNTATAMMDSPDYAIMFGPDLSRLQYYSPESGQYEDFSLQRTMYHELIHFARHGDEVRGDRSNQQDLEAEAVEETNKFMSKYYGEPVRGDYGDLKKEGTPGIQIRRGFNPGGRKMVMDQEGMNLSFEYNSLPASDFSGVITRISELLASGLPGSFSASTQADIPVADNEPRMPAPSQQNIMDA